MSSPRATELLELEYGKGWKTDLITASGAETKTVKAAPGKVACVKANGAYDVTLKDDATAKFAVVNNALLDLSGCPIQCDTSIKLTFGGAGSAWIIYK